MHVTIKNLTPGVRVFKNLNGQDVTIKSQEERSFEMHPHHVRQIKREAEKENPMLELAGDPDEINDVDKPGGNMTGEEKAKQILARQAEVRRLHELRVQAGLEPPDPVSAAMSKLADAEHEPPAMTRLADPQEVEDVPTLQTDPTNSEGPARNQRRKYR